jgi:hypothetical protein
VETVKLALAAAVVAIAACGRVGFDRLAADATQGSDAGACLGTGVFTAVQSVAAINDSDTQYAPFITPDGLAVLWDQNTGMFDQVFMTQRPSRADAFPSGVVVPILFSGANGNASDPSITGDLLELYFASDITGSLCVYRATRTSTAAAFDPAVELGALCSAVATTGPSISADGLTLVYSSALDARVEGDLFITARADRTADFPTGKKLNGLPTGIGYPWLSRDRLRVWFEEEVGPDVEIASAQRISPSDDFSSLHGLTELDTGTANGNPSLTPDESEIVFSSQRTGDYDTYIASRPCL